MIISPTVAKQFGTPEAGSRPESGSPPPNFQGWQMQLSLDVLNPKTCYTDWCESGCSHPFSALKERECREKVRRAEIPGNGQVVDSALGESFAAQRGWTC
jgi:hypothetical protein